MRPAHRHTKDPERRESGLVARRCYEAMPDPEDIAEILDDDGASREARLGHEPRPLRHQDNHPIAETRSRGARGERELVPFAASDAAHSLAIENREPSPSVADHQRTVSTRRTARRPAPAAGGEWSSPTTEGPCDLTSTVRPTECARP